MSPPKIPPIVLPELVQYLLQRIYSPLVPERESYRLTSLSIEKLTSDEARHRGHQPEEGRHTFHVLMEVNGVRLDTHVIETGDASWSLHDTYIVFEAPPINKERVIALIKGSIDSHAAVSDDPNMSDDSRTITVRLSFCA